MIEITAEKPEAKWTQKAIDDFVSNTLPPDIKIRPRDSYSYSADSNIPNLFSRALGVAVLRLLRNNDRRILDALRKKWPDAVEKELPSAEKRHNGKAFLISKMGVEA